MVHQYTAEEGLYNIHCDSCGSLCCYADDSSFFVASSDLGEISEKVSEKYSKISEFMSSNRLKLNEEKTNLMLLATEKSWR